MSLPCSLLLTFVSTFWILDIFNVLLKTLFWPHIFSLGSVFHFMTLIPYPKPFFWTLYPYIQVPSWLLRAPIGFFILMWPKVNTLLSLLPPIQTRCPMFSVSVNSTNILTTAHVKKPRHLLFLYSLHVISHQILLLLLLQCILNDLLSISTVTP